MYNPYNNYPNGYLSNLSQQNTPIYNNRPAQQQVPFQDVRFVTEQEAGAYIVMANQRVLLIDVQQGKAWVKSADSWGQSFIEPYTFSKVGANTLSPDANADASKGSEYLKKEDLPDLATKEDIKYINDEITSLKKQIENKSLLVVKPERKSEEI